MQNNYNFNKTDFVEIEGAVCRVKFQPIRKIFYNDKGSFGIFYGSVDGKVPVYQNEDNNICIVIKGTLPDLQMEEQYNIVAKTVHDEKYGWQYAVEELYSIEPMDEEKQAEYLKSVLERDVISEQILEYYPNIINEVMDGTDNINFALIKGLGEASWKKMKAKIIDNYYLADIYIKLKPVGVTPTMIKKLVKAYKNPITLKQTLDKNPYTLTELHGFGFGRVDALVIKMDPTFVEKIERLEAFTKYYLQQIGEVDGHTWIPEQIYRTEVSNNVPETVKWIDKFLQESDIIYCKNGRIGLVEYRDFEKRIYNTIKRKMTSEQNYNFSDEEIKTAISQAEKQQGFEYSDEQKEAIYNTLQHNFSILTGKAGCVDCDTEYFNGTEWKRIADYTVGEKVLQYNIDTQQAILIQPLKYIKIKCDKLYYFCSTDIDQCLSLEHRILYYKSINKQIELKEMTVEEYLNNPQSFFIPFSFYYNDINTNVLKKNLCLQSYFDLEKMEIKEYKTIDGYKYCFSVPTGALILRRNNKIFITGNSGKTSITKAILNAYNNRNLSIGTCALSAMAAKRISEATLYPAMTIHRELGVDKHGQFICNENNPLLVDFAFMDETSMVNANLFNSWLSSIRDSTNILLSGDARQLPPIGFGNIFSDLCEIIDKDEISELKTPMRQALKSGILVDANLIRDNISPISQNEINNPKIIHGELQDMQYRFRTSREEMFDTAIRLYISAIKQQNIDDVAIIVPRKSDCINSTNELNKRIQQILLGSEKKSIIIRMGESQTEFKLGAKVMQIKNDYERKVFNGDVGYIVDIPNTSDCKCIVRFNLPGGEVQMQKYNYYQMQQLELAYALTAHKCQGQSIKSVICIIDNTHYKLLDSCLLYTMLTRAKERCCLLAEPTAFFQCIKTSHNKRHTWLSTLVEK